MRPSVVVSLFACVAACSSDPAPPGTGNGTVVPLGTPVSGDYSLGPVEWTGSFWNSCGPYVQSTQTAYGTMLAGTGLQYNGQGQLCDACIQVTTRLGKTVVARVVTTGDTKSPGDLDLSTAANGAIFQDDPQGTPDHPRPMTWQTVKCPGNLQIAYQFQTGAHVDWSSLWVRNISKPITKVEVKSARHADFAPLDRGTDGTWTDNGGFGTGSFTLRVTSVDGQLVTDTFPGFKGGDLLASASNFP